MKERVNLDEEEVNYKWLRKGRKEKVDDKKVDKDEVIEGG